MAEDVWCRIVVDGETMALLRFPIRLADLSKVWPGGSMSHTGTLEECLAEMQGEGEVIDPVGCGCTDCLTGYSRPALDLAEYERAKRRGTAR